MKKILALLVTAFFAFGAKAQTYGYSYVETVSSSGEDVTFIYKVFCPKKKELSQAGLLAGLRCVMFEGIPVSRFSKPFLPEGEKTAIAGNKAYFDDLYGNRASDFIKDCTMVSKFKKSGDKQSTLFKVTVKASALRKDLEKNKVKVKMGI